MTEDTPKLTPFESLVLQRFDKIDERLEKLEAGQAKLEAGQSEINERLEKLEARTFDTKPIWERALAEILEVSDRLRVLTEMFHKNTMEMGLQHLRLERRVSELETRP